MEYLGILIEIIAPYIKYFSAWVVSEMMAIVDKMSGESQLFFYSETFKVFVSLKISLIFSRILRML